MAEFASKGIAGTGLGLGIAGTALSLLNGNGLGGVLGGNNCASVIAEKDAKIAELTAQKYSDNQDAVLYQATRAENKNLRDEVFAYVTPIAQEAASNRERVAVLEAKQACEAENAALREKLVKAELGARIDTVAQTCSCGISQLNNAVAAINTTLGAITQTVIPKSAICPEVMSRYNSWTAPTAAATNEG